MKRTNWAHVIKLGIVSFVMIFCARPCHADDLASLFKPGFRARAAEGMSGSSFETNDSDLLTIARSKLRQPRTIWSASSVILREGTDAVLFSTSPTGIEASRISEEGEFSPPVALRAVGRILELDAIAGDAGTWFVMSLSEGRRSLNLLHISADLTVLRESVVYGNFASVTIARNGRHLAIAAYTGNELRILRLDTDFHYLGDDGIDSRPSPTAIVSLKDRLFILSNSRTGLEGRDLSLDGVPGRSFYLGHGNLQSKMVVSGEKIFVLWHGPRPSGSEARLVTVESGRVFRDEILPLAPGEFVRWIDLLVKDGEPVPVLALGPPGLATRELVGFRRVQDAFSRFELMKLPEETLPANIKRSGIAASEWIVVGKPLTILRLDSYLKVVSSKEHSLPSRIYPTGVASSGTGFLVGLVEGESRRRISVRLLYSSGEPGPEVVLDEGLVSGAVIKAVPGGYLAAWNRYVPEDEKTHLVAQRFSAEGRPVGERVKVGFSSQGEFDFAASPTAVQFIWRDSEELLSSQLTGDVLSLPLSLTSRDRCDFDHQPRIVWNGTEFVAVYGRFNNGCSPFPGGGFGTNIWRQIDSDGVARRPPRSLAGSAKVIESLIPSGTGDVLVTLRGDRSIEGHLIRNRTETSELLFTRYFDVFPSTSAFREDGTWKLITSQSFNGRRSALTIETPLEVTAGPVRVREFERDHYFLPYAATNVLGRTLIVGSLSSPDVARGSTVVGIFSEKVTRFLSPPVAPSGATFWRGAQRNQAIVVWKDRSDNEEGFGIEGMFSSLERNTEFARVFLYESRRMWAWNWAGRSELVPLVEGAAGRERS